MLTQVLLLLLGQLQPLSLQALDHGLPQLGALPRAVGPTQRFKQNGVISELEHSEVVFSIIWLHR